MPLQTIVVGVDFSPASDVAAHQALALARRAGAKLVLAHAASLPDAPEGVPESMQTTTEAFQKILRDRLDDDRGQLGELGTRLGGQGAEVSHVLVDGFADDALVQAAQELHADLIVAGSHGRRGLGRLLLGSVAERLTRIAHVPVLVARGSTDAAEGGFHHIVCATDFSDAAERGLDLALELAAPGATIDLAHFWQMPVLSRAHAADEVDATMDEIRQNLEEAGQARGARALEGRDHRSATVRYTLREGDTRDGIVDLARAVAADLVVVGSHGRRGLRRFLLGSVAESTVRHAPCSVLVAR
jgi:nucleotide-binding universal stress UspA family protein